MTQWDPDGAGPAPALIVLAGSFSVAGPVATAGLATWSPQTGTFGALPAPPGLDSNYRELAVTANGELIAAYDTVASTTGRVARFDGAQWTVLGGDFGQAVTAMLVRPNGDLIVGGSFTVAGAVAAPGIARWNGTSWQPIGSGFACQANALANGPAGELVVAGYVSVGSPSLQPGVASWNGTSWSTVGSAFTGVFQWPQSVATASGRLFVGTWAGLFEFVGGAWSLVPGISAGTLPPRVATLLPLASGQLLVGSNLTLAGGVATRSFARLDPTSGAWSTFGAGAVLQLDDCSAVERANGEIVVGGRMPTAGGIAVANLARWTGAAWTALDAGPADGVQCAVVVDDVQFYVGGSFQNVGNQLASRVAQWNGAGWQPVGSGLGGDVVDLALLPNGDLIAGGTFSSTGSGAVARGLARWDGTTWSEFGGVTGGQANVTSLLRRRNGDLVVGGSFTAIGGVACSNIASWNGSSWSNLDGGVGYRVVALAEGPDGNLLVATSTPNGSEILARGPWPGWLQFGSFSDQITDLAVLPDGRLVATAYYQVAYAPRAVLLVGAQRLEGQSQTLATGLVQLPGGDLLASGSFWSLSDGFGLTVNGPGCIRIPASIGSPLVAGPAAYRIADADAFPNGDRLLVALAGGAGDTVFQVGRLSTNCPAGVASTGSGCNANVLIATSLPWLGATTRATATGLPANSIAIDVLGLGPVSVPLASLLPIGQPGCDLLVSPDLFGALLAPAGLIEVALALPNDLALVGAVLHRQVLALAANAAGALTSLTSTNALQLTIGAF